MKYKKLTLAILLLTTILTACARRGTQTGATGSGDAADGGPVQLDTLTILLYEADGVTDAATDDLAAYLQNGFKSNGIEIGEVVFTTAPADRAAEVLIRGDADVALLPANQYVLYSDTLITPVLSATHTGTGEGAEAHSDALLLATNSDKGQALADKAAAGTAITWEELTDCVWAIGNDTQDAATYLFPNLWLSTEYAQSVSALPYGMRMGETEAFQRAAAGQIDLLVCDEGALARNVQMWSEDLRRETPIEEELRVVAVTGTLPGDVLCVRAEDEVLSGDAFIKAATEVFQVSAYAEQASQLLTAYGYAGFTPVDTSVYGALLDAIRKVSE